MNLPTQTRQSRALAIGLLVLAILLAYLVGIHWWFTAPFLQARSDLIEARDQELQMRSAAQQRDLIQQRLEEVRSFESANPEFLPEANFDLAASSLIQRLQSLVDGLQAGPACTIVSRTPFRTQSEEPFERVTIKVRMRCEVEQLSQVLHGIESGSPQLFVTDFVVTSRRQFGARQGAQLGAIDSSFDLYGYLRKRPEEPEA